MVSVEIGIVLGKSRRKMKVKMTLWDWLCALLLAIWLFPIACLQRWQRRGR